MRELTGQDTFLLLPVIHKLGIVDVIKAAQAAQEDITVGDEPNYEEIGLVVMGAIFDVVLKNAPKAQREINKVLSAVCDKTIKEIEALDFVTYNMLLIELLSQEAFVNFTKQLSSLMQ